MYNLISIGSLFSLSSIHKGARFRAALKAALWNSADRAKQYIYGIGGNQMPIMGYVNLMIRAGDSEVEVPFAITHEGTERIILGTPALQALKFKLQSPLFKGVNFIEPPSKRKIDSSLNFSAGTQNEQQASRDSTPSAQAPKQSKGGHKKTGKQSGGPSTAPKANKNAGEQPTPAPAVDAPKLRGRPPLKTKNKGAAGSVDKAKSAAEQDNHGKSETEIKKNKLLSTFKQHEHVEIKDNGEIVPQSQVFRLGVAAHTRFK